MASGAAVNANEPPVPQTLGQALNDKLRELLVQKKWSQQELGRRMGLSQGGVSYQLASKRRVKALNYYERIASEVFDMPLSALIADLERRVDGAAPPDADRNRSNAQMTDRPFIVGEVSKNWRAGTEVVPGSGLLCERFEEMVNHNAACGYRLMQFQLHRTMTGFDEMNETIIAVFERKTRPS
jgi:transcriptional regulator with XRE-family HTH domain